MNRHMRFLATTVAGAVLLLTACGGSDDAGGAAASAPTGEPVAGGAATVLMLSDPATFDPALLGNVYATNPAVGNALYGTLLTNDTETNELQPQMAESLTSEDDGSTFELKLQPGLTFTDGTALDAEAVKFNWDRLKDPALRAPHAVEAAMIASTEVVDPTTLKATLTSPVSNFPQAVVTSSLNWIASPTALKAGKEKFDANPVGAGPFTLKSWTRQGDIDLVKNPDFWDAPKPYLDTLTLRAVSDGAQRLNSVMAGDADVTIESNWENIRKAQEADLPVDVQVLNGGLFLALNNRRAPFADPRAREALSLVIDNEALNSAVYVGAADMVDTLFAEESPFHTDTELRTADRERAQELFDELAAEGKPVSFTFSTYPTSENRAMAEAVQAQLAGFDNVKVEVKVIDFAELPKIYATNDFDVLTGSAAFNDPEPTLFNVFHSQSRRNLSGVSDPELDEALQVGRTASETEERAEAYATVTERLAELNPVIFISRAAPAAIGAEGVRGLQQYGAGSLIPELIYLQK